MISSRRLEIADAIALLQAARAVFLDLPSDEDSLPLPLAAKRISVSPDWLRKHLAECPNAWRLPAGDRQVNGEGRNVGELRIPVNDLKAFQERQRLQPK